MAEQKSGAQISKKAFLQAVIIIFILMMASGILTRLVPAGSYTRVEQNGRLVIDPASFTLTARPNYQVWRWFTAPFEVLGGPDSVTVIAIVLFILLVTLAGLGIVFRHTNQQSAKKTGRMNRVILRNSFFMTPSVIRTGNI